MLIGGGTYLHTVCLCHPPPSPPPPRPRDRGTINANKSFLSHSDDANAREIKLPFCQDPWEGRGRGEESREAVFRSGREFWQICAGAVKGNLPRCRRGGGGNLAEGQREREGGEAQSCDSAFSS